MVASAGAGSHPIPHAELDPDILAAAIQFCLTPEAASAAQDIAVKMQAESGVSAAVESFHRNLHLDRMRCSIIPDQVAQWTYTTAKSLHLSRPAVNILMEHNRIDAKQIKRYSASLLLTFQDRSMLINLIHSYPTNPIIIENRRWDPLTGVLSASAGMGATMAKSTGEMLYNPYKELKRSRASNSSDQHSQRSDSFAASSFRSDTTLSSDQRTQNSQSQMNQSNNDPFDTAGRMAGAGLQSFGKFSATYFRGVIVDIPHAAAEGFRRAPQLYGEKPKDYGTVHDWKSGIKVGGKNFVGGMTSGVAGMLTEPLKGALEDGRDGALRGLTRGALGMATKMPSGE